MARAGRIVSSLILLCCLTSAETIRLKNGRTILADAVHENGERLEYEVGDNTYAIPRNTIERIDTGGAPASSDHAAPIDIPQPEVDAGSRISGASPFHGPWTPEALEQIEQTHDPLALAGALLYAAREEQTRGKLGEARAHLERALTLFPNDPTLLEHYVVVLLQSDRAAVAVKYAQEACRQAPESADAHALLGYAYFKNDRTKEAIAEWNASLAIKEDPRIRKYLERAQGEMAVETGYSEQGSSHFSLRYEGKQTPDAFRRLLLDTLERHYTDLVNEIGVLPRDSITVVLYTNQAFFDVTHAPSWTAALNDGKLRLPVEGMQTVSPELSRILKHELAHSFINQASRGRCPYWLNEGIAQMVEPQSAEQFKRGLARLYKEEAAPPLASLQNGFMGYSNLQAAIAYAVSLSVTQYIRDTYGAGALKTILQRLSEGVAIDEALRAAIHSDQKQLEKEFADAVIRTAGG